MHCYSHEAEESEILYILSLEVLTLKYSLIYIKILENYVDEFYSVSFELNVYKLSS